MNYRHFIITRFNLKHSDDTWKKDKSGNIVLTDKWMDKRMEIFKKYCLPSVLNQSSKKFSWMIYIDSDTKEKYKKQFERLSKLNSHIIIKKVSSYKEFQNNYCRDLINLTTANECSHLITTRLDNDDIIHKDFILKIQEQFDYQEYMAVNFLKILMINPTNNNRLNIDYQFSNHFISLIERIKRGVINGCYSKGDRYWDVPDKIIQVTKIPYCVEIISDQNLINNFRGFPIFKRTSLKKFNLDLIYRSKYLDYNNYKLLKMSWRKYLRYQKLCLTKNKQH